MSLTCFFVDDSAVTTDLHCLATVALLRRDEFDPAVAVTLVVPIHKSRYPLTGLFFARK